MRRVLHSFLVVALLCNLLVAAGLSAQERKGSVTGHATDTNHDALVGARIELQPLGRTAASDAEGQFTIRDLAPGKYTLTVSYVGWGTRGKIKTPTLKNRGWGTRRKTRTTRRDGAELGQWHRLFHSVIGGFAGDDHVVDMGFAETGGGDTDKAGFFAEIF